MDRGPKIRGICLPRSAGVRHLRQPLLIDTWTVPCRAASLASIAVP